MNSKALNLKFSKKRQYWAKTIIVSCNKTRKSSVANSTENLLSKIMSNTIDLPRNVKHLWLKLISSLKKLAKDFLILHGVSEVETLPRAAAPAKTKQSVRKVG